MKHERMGCVCGVRPEDLAGYHDGKRRLILLHKPRLDRRGVAPQEIFLIALGLQVERIERVARRMFERNVQRLEIIVFGLDLGAFHNAEAERDEYGAYLIYRLRYRVGLPYCAGYSREGYIYSFAGPGPFG